MGRSPAIVYVAERPSVALVWRHFTHRRDTVELLLRLALHVFGDLLDELRLVFRAD